METEKERGEGGSRQTDRHIWVREGAVRKDRNEQVGEWSREK